MLHLHHEDEVHRITQSQSRRLVVVQMSAEVGGAVAAWAAARKDHIVSQMVEQEVHAVGR